MNVYWNERQEANPTLMFGCDNQPRKVGGDGYVVADGVICRTGASLYIH